MAKIDIYNAKGLAKQAVGTPGVDTTGEEIYKLSSSITKATNQYIEAETNKLKIANNIQGEVEKLKFENELYNKFEQDKQNVDNINNPYGLADSSYTTAESMAQEYAKNISNPYVREIFQQKASIIPGQAQKQMTQWAGHQTTTNALVSVKEGMDGIISQASKMTDLNGYMGSLAQGEALIANAMPVIGVDNAYKLRQQLRKDAAESFLYPKMDQSPGTVKAYIESGKFDDVLDGRDKAQLLHTCDTIAKRNTARMEEADALRVGNIIQSVGNKAYSGTLTLKEIDDAIAATKGSGKYATQRRAYLEGVRKEFITKGQLDYAGIDELDAVAKTKMVFEDLKALKKKQITMDDLVKAEDSLEANRRFLSKETYANNMLLLNQKAAEYVSTNSYAKNAKKERERLSSLLSGDPSIFKNEMGRYIYSDNLYRGMDYFDKVYSDSKKANMAKGIYSTIYNANYQAAYKKSTSQTGRWSVDSYKQWCIRETRRRMGG